MRSVDYSHATGSCNNVPLPTLRARPSLCKLALMSLRSTTTWVAAALLPALALAGTEWPQFRGPNGDGISTEAAFSGLDRFDLVPTWKQKIGSGYSGISIADGRVVTMFSDGTSDVAAAFDESSGKELWRFTVEPTYEG